MRKKQPLSEIETQKIGSQKNRVLLLEQISKQKK